MYTVNHSWLYGAVKPYFEKQGIKLLRDDMLFIEQCLNKVPPERHRTVMKDYFQVWNTTVVTRDNVDSTKLNPRYEANIYLRNAADEK
jgi:hypothetical protein